MWKPLSLVLIGVAWAVVPASGRAADATDTPPAAHAPVILFTDFSSTGSTEDWLDMATAIQRREIDLQVVVLEVETARDTAPRELLYRLCERMRVPSPTVIIGSTRDELTATKYRRALKDGVATLLKWLKALPAGRKATVVCTGRLTNAWELMRRDPKTVKERVHRFYVAAGYLHSPNLEYFAGLDKEAWVNAMRSGMPITLVPRDVAGAPVSVPITDDQMADLMSIKGEEIRRPAWTSTMPIWMLLTTGGDAAPWAPAVRVRPCRFEVSYSGHTRRCTFDAGSPNMAMVTEMTRPAALAFLAGSLGEPDLPGVGEPALKEAFHRLPGARRVALAGLHVGDRVIAAARDNRGGLTVAALDVKTGAWRAPATPVPPTSAPRPLAAGSRPSLFADEAGRAHVLVGAGAGVRHLVEASGGRSGWRDADRPPVTGPGAQAFRLADGKVHLFCPDGADTGPWVHLVGDDAAAAWGAREAFIHMGAKPDDAAIGAACVLQPGARNDSLHAVWCLVDGHAARVNDGAIDAHPVRSLKYRHLAPWAYRYNLYYLRFSVKDGTWQTARGEAVTLPVTRAVADERCRIIETGDLFAWPEWIVVDAEDRPYIVYRSGAADLRASPAPMVWRVTARDGDGWLDVLLDEAPRDWAGPVLTALRGRGVPVRVADGVGDDVWSLSWRRFWREGLALFLWNPREGYAPRPGVVPPTPTSGPAGE